MIIIIIVITIVNRVVICNRTMNDYYICVCVCPLYVIIKMCRQRTINEAFQRSDGSLKYFKGKKKNVTF